MARPGMASVRMEIKCREILELNPSMRVAKAAKKMVTFMTGPDDEDVSTDTIEKTAPAVVESEPFTQLFADEEPGVILGSLDAGKPTRFSPEEKSRQEQVERAKDWTVFQANLKTFRAKNTGRKIESAASIAAAEALENEYELVDEHDAVEEFDQIKKEDAIERFVVINITSAGNIRVCRERSHKVLSYENVY